MRAARTAATIPLAEAARAWLVAVEAAGRSSLTSRTYHNAWRALERLLGPRALGAVTADDLRRALVALRGRYRPKSVQTYAAAWRALFAWCVAEGLLRESPMARVPVPQPPLVERPGLTAEEIARLARACEGRTLRDARDRALVLTLLATGLRASELLQLRRADVEEAAGLLRVRGKGNRERVIALERVARAAVSRYLLLRGQDGEPALWLGERGPLTLRGLWEVCRRRGEQAGIPGLHPHRLRRAALGLWLDAGLPEEAVRFSADKEAEWIETRTRSAWLDRHPCFSADKAAEWIETDRDRPRRIADGLVSPLTKQRSGLKHDGYAPKTLVTSFSADKAAEWIETSSRTSSTRRSRVSPLTKQRSGLKR
jgi:integrase/recombinase XerD